MASNCLASASLGCLFCCQGCNAEKVRNAFAFLPPTPSYAIQEDVEGQSVGRFEFRSELLQTSDFYGEAAAHASAHFVRTFRGERVPVAWVRATAVKGPRKAHPIVLLYCHGNATDIGLMLAPYFELARRLACEVVGVEYSGYGSASGSPSTANVIADAEAAYDFVVASGVPPQRIVAYGQSVGSGPALHLAASRQLGGVILHSPMLSGIKVIDPQPNACCRPSCVYHCFDFFDNGQNVRRASCPVFVIHGLHDDIVLPYHGMRLAEAAPPLMRWPAFLPEDAGHNDLVERNVMAYFGTLLAFLRHVQELADTGENIGKDTPAPNLVGKPEQQEMSEPWPRVVAWEGGEPTCAAPAPPSDAAALGPSVAADVSGRISGERPFAEPRAGPEDGRYASLRRPCGV